MGTRSLLFGYHQFILHPLVLAVAWTKLYGFPRDWRLWMAFFVHDLGYVGKNQMDGPDGELHPYFGARFMHSFFGGKKGAEDHLTWYNFMLYHSRFLAKQDGAQPSKLCYADKLAIIILPAWIQVLLMSLTGEIHEYMRAPHKGTTSGDGMTRLQWVNAMKQHLRLWFREQGYHQVIFQPEPTYCPGCKHEIDPDICCCGDGRNRFHDNHQFIPMGCRCFEDKGEA